MTDAISSALHYALNGLSDRQHTISNNIANIQTPGYLAGETDFETALKDAMNGKSVIRADSVHKTSLAPTRTDGNNVDLDNETMTATDTELKYQAVIEAVNAKYKTIRNAIGA